MGGRVATNTRPWRWGVDCGLLREATQHGSFLMCGSCRWMTQRRRGRALPRTLGGRAEQTWDSPCSMGRRQRLAAVQRHRIRMMYGSEDRRVTAHSPLRCMCPKGVIWVARGGRRRTVLGLATGTCGRRRGTWVLRLTPRLKSCDPTDSRPRPGHVGLPAHQPVRT